MGTPLRQSARVEVYLATGGSAYFDLSLDDLASFENQWEQRRIDSTNDTIEIRNEEHLIVFLASKIIGFAVSIQIEHSIYNIDRVRYKRSSKAFLADSAYPELEAGESELAYNLRNYRTLGG